MLLTAIREAVTIVHQNPSILKSSTILSVTQRKNALITSLKRPNVKKMSGNDIIVTIQPRKKLRILYTRATMIAV
jgi:hypothetical protein